MYLPYWGDGLSWQEQYDCYWIMGINGINKPAYESLFPIRFYDKDNRGYYYEPESVENGVKTNSKYVYAYELWKASAVYLAYIFPCIENLKIGKQRFDGIYPIEFHYPVKEVEKMQIEVMKDLINDGFPENKEIIFDNGETAAKFKKGTHYSYEQCAEYYKSFDEKMLVIANQRRVYMAKDSYLLSVINSRDADAVKAQIKGRNLNDIYDDGSTLFADIAYRWMNLNDFYDTMTDSDYAFLDELVDMGANPAIYGNFEDSLLLEAVTSHRTRFVKWLLEKGVNPNIHPFLDDYYDAPKTLLDWVYQLCHERYLDEDPSIYPENLKTIELLELYGAE